MEKKKITGVGMVNALVLVFLIFSSGVLLSNNQPVQTRSITTNVEQRSEFGSYFKEPMIIEKEVIVYVEPEPMVASIEEPEPIIEEIIVQPIDGNFDIFTPSNYTYDDLYKALDEGPHAGLQHLIGAFMDAEDIYGVNALYLMSTIGWESGWGRYHSGYNNIAGWKGGPGGTWSDFDSEYDCVMTVAEALSTWYRETVGGSLSSVTSMYCPDPGYTDSILQIMYEQQSKILY